MTLNVTPQHNGFGATITGLALNASLDAGVVCALRAAWLSHQVLSFPKQPMDHADLERFTLAFGSFGDDPYVQPIDGHRHILEVRREPAEKISPFGAAWHSDWSFQSSPPSATILHSKIVPPLGGDTWYANGYAAYEALEAGLRSEISDLVAIHSARRPYSHEGFLAGGGKSRSMTILPSAEALQTQEHPLVRTHPETGRKALWVNSVYSIGIKGLTHSEGKSLLEKLFAHSVRDEFVYRHRWSHNMLTMWDNRCVQHCAQGGYDGHRRVMHRTTVAGDAPF
ncbi:MAG: TauD/TfdA family dioxygenase [Gammaproteobacteria bacterium]|nr:TauD/TfdA family dioxygenase [Gammaproteobacteria bacterium]